MDDLLDSGIKAEKGAEKVSDTFFGQKRCRTPFRVRSAEPKMARRRMW